MVMFVWITVGGLVVLLGLLDLTDYLLARAGKRSLLHRRPLQDRLTDARNAAGTTAEAQHSAFKNMGDAPPGV